MKKKQRKNIEKLTKMFRKQALKKAKEDWIDIQCKEIDVHRTVFNLRIQWVKYLHNQQKLHHVFIDFKTKSLTGYGMQPYGLPYGNKRSMQS